MYGGVRKPENAVSLRQHRVTPITIDVTSEDLCQKAVDEIIRIEGGLDVLINNAGYGAFGAIEDVSMEEAQRQFEVNVFGLARLTKMVLPYMRKQHSGKIINVSSIGGKIVSYMGAWYHASKYAVEALSDALRMEVSDFGVDVVLMEPGGVKTGWWKIAAEHLRRTAKNGAYESSAEKIADGMLKLHKNKLMTDPKVIAKKMVKVVNKNRPKARYLIGFGAKPLLFVHSVLPDRWYDWLAKHAM